MFRQVLNADPDNEVAHADLDRLFEATGAWDDLVALLLSKVGQASDEVQRGLLERVAEVHDTQRGDAEAAIQVYERINSDLGADERSLRALAGLYERKESWTKVADTLERLSGRLEGPGAVAMLPSRGRPLGAAGGRPRAGGQGASGRVRPVPARRDDA